jgi:4-amino-4-deoxy-L-arabinose transferase-like glycosyltransferase/DNA-binding beta-propeller fold protein YncE
MRTMRPRLERIPWLWVVLFLFALSVRLYRVDWDQHHFFHPDERAIGFAVERLSFSPFQWNPRFFAYGSFPMYVIRVASSLASLARPVFRGFDEVILVGRAVSAFWGAGTVVLLALLGWRLYDRATGLFAGFLLAASVSHVQNSHFAVSDVPLTALVLATLFFLVRAVEQGGIRRFALAGACLGLAVATKFSAVPLLLPALVALLFFWRSGASWRRVGLAALALSLAGAAAFFAGQPYAVLDFKAWSHDVLEQSQMVRHAGSVPYTNQYVGTPKYLYDLEQLVLWGMGPALGLAALVGAGWAAFRAVSRKQAPQIVLLAWVVPYFLVTGYFEVKFPRYLLPIYPVLALWAAAWLVEKWRAARGWRLAGGFVVGATLAWLAAFESIYSRPHSFVTASEWFYENAAAGSKVLEQDWDEGFPFPLSGGRTADLYVGRADCGTNASPCGPAQLSFYENDGEGKLLHLSSSLASSEWLVLQTNRIYGAIGRVPGKYPITWKLFRQLFAGKLGYELQADFASRPALFGIQVPTELADESFSVYDHPKVLIFRNTGRFSQQQIAGVVRSPEVPDLSRRDLLLASAAHRPSAVMRTERTSLPQTDRKEATAPPGRFEQPRGLAVDRLGNIYVADFGHHRIQKLSASLAPISVWGSHGSGPGQFDQPAAVAVAPDGRVFVADTWNGRIQVLSSEGEPLAQWSADFYGPRGLALDGRGGVYVADTGNSRIVHLSSEGAVLMRWGRRGSGPGELQDPVGIAVDGRGRIWVCDNGNARLEIYDARGALEREIPVDGWRREVFSEPQAAPDKDGGVWVTVPLANEVRLYSPQGKLSRQIRGAGAKAGSFTRPMGVAVSKRELVVSDLEGRIVRVPLENRPQASAR